MSIHRDAAISDPPSLKVDFPPAFGYDHLSLLLGRSVPTLQMDRFRKPWTLPPACTPPGTKSPRWLLTDVLAWLAQHREAKAKNQQQPQVEKKKVGAPTKAKRVAARRASVLATAADVMA